MAGIYVHIPFCKQRCIYCDFYSTTLHGLMGSYVESVCREARMRCISPVRTVYVGGGTPSQLPAETMMRLVEGLRRAYDLSVVEEFTIEVNPDDVTEEYMSMLMSAGVNRISMGVQSFVDAELATINRRHDDQGAMRAGESIRSVGIDNISIDLIYGIPGQTPESWRYSVGQAIRAGVQHISAYNLSYEPGTRLWRMREAGEVTEADDATCVEMYDTLTVMLRESGYEHYEISNFALPGRESRHNSSYWDGTPYVGLGASAHSYDGRVRSYNPASVREYIDKIEKGELPGIVESSEWWERYDEAVMVSLRTARGLDLDKIGAAYGNDVREELLRKAGVYIGGGKLLREGSRLRIPEGAWMMSDAIIRDLMWDV